MVMEIGSSQGSLIKRWTGGMQFMGRVTAVPGANQFKIPSLANVLPAGALADATAPYYAVVLWSHLGAGGPPQGEKKVLTGYVSATGVFTAPGFTAPGVGVDDLVQIVSGAGYVYTEDGIWFNSVFGVPGVVEPIGTAQHPSNGGGAGSLADVRAMLLARKTRIIYPSCALTLDADMLDANSNGFEWIGCGITLDAIQIDLNSKNASRSTFRNVSLTGNHGLTNDIAIHDSLLSLTAPGCYNMIATGCVLSTGYIGYGSILSDCRPYGVTTIHVFNFAGTVRMDWLNWHGDVTLADMQAGNELHITGSGIITLDASCTGGDLYIDKNMQLIDNSGGLVTVHWTGGGQKDMGSTPVSINAILASETAILNLPAVANLTYQLNHLRLKSTDPGLNFVRVRLYEEINAILTLVDSFDIGTTGAANEFTDYFSLIDMFSLDHSSGNNIKVTVQATGGGPYAVTANYSYSQANV